jgi:hypothetical protein
MQLLPRVGAKPVSLRHFQEDQAAEIAEAAVILPALLLLLFSIYWFGRAYSVYGAINHAAREGARTAATPAGCANCSITGTWSNSDLPDDPTVVQAVNNSLMAAHLDPAQAIPSAPTPTPQSCPDAIPEGVCAQATGGQFTICRNVLLNQGSTAPAVCGVIISFQYPHQFVLPFTSLNNQQILLKAQVEMRSED